MIKLLIIDVDGIMTTGMKYYNREGEVKLKTFCDNSTNHESICNMCTSKPLKFSAAVQSEIKKKVIHV